MENQINSTDFYHPDPKIQRALRSLYRFNLFNKEQCPDLILNLEIQILKLIFSQLSSKQKQELSNSWPIYYNKMILSDKILEVNDIIDIEKHINNLH